MADRDLPRGSRGDLIGEGSSLPTTPPPVAAKEAGQRAAPSNRSGGIPLHKNSRVWLERCVNGTTLNEEVPLPLPSHPRASFVSLYLAYPRRSSPTRLTSSTLACGHPRLVSFRSSNVANDDLLFRLRIQSTGGNGGTTSSTNTCPASCGGTLPRRVRSSTWARPCRRSSTRSRGLRTRLSWDPGAFKLASHRRHAPRYRTVRYRFAGNVAKGGSERYSFERIETKYGVKVIKVPARPTSYMPSNPLQSVHQALFKSYVQSFQALTLIPYDFPYAAHLGRASANTLKSGVHSNTSQFTPLPPVLIHKPSQPSSFTAHALLPALISRASSWPLPLHISPNSLL